MGAKVVWHAKYVTIQMAGVAVPRELFAAILERIQRFGVPPPLPEMRTGRAMSQDRAILAAKAKNLPGQVEEGGPGPYTSAVRAVWSPSKSTLCAEFCLACEGEVCADRIAGVEPANGKRLKKGRDNDTECKESG